MTESAAAPAISLITTCKGRLSSLKQSLPRMVAQPRAEVIVVDYDCPERSGGWVAEEYPAARVVQIGNAPVFNMAHARNLGAQAARAEWLCFVDADSLLDDRFVEQALPRLHHGGFYSMADARFDAAGTIICAREDFIGLEGYDEVLQGWGAEDDDFRLRLRVRGCAHETLPGEWLRTIGHDDAARVQYYDIKDRWLSQRINASYVQIKHDLARQFGKPDLPLDARRAVYAQVRQTLQRGAESGNGSVRIQITLPPELVVRFRGWHMTRSWVYEIAPAPPLTAAGSEPALHVAPI